MTLTLLTHIALSFIAIFIGTWYLGTILMLVGTLHKKLNIQIQKSINFKQRIKLELFRSLCLIYYILWILYFYIAFKLIWIN